MSALRGLSCCFAWQAWRFVTLHHVSRRVKNRFVWQPQYFGYVFQRCVERCVKWWQGLNSVAGVAFCDMSWTSMEAWHDIVASSNACRVVMQRVIEAGTLLCFLLLVETLLLLGVIFVVSSKGWSASTVASRHTHTCRFQMQSSEVLALFSVACGLFYYLAWFSLFSVQKVGQLPQ